VACVNATTFRPQGIPKQVLHQIRPGASHTAPVAA